MRQAHHIIGPSGRHRAGPLALAAAVALLVCVGATTAAAAPAEDAPPSPEADEPPGLAVGSPVGDLRYTPGRGLRLGHTGLSLGGYATATLTRDEGRSAKIGTDELSLFVIWDPLAYVHVFSELESESLLYVDDGGRGGTGERAFVAERLYGDLTVSNAANVRVGKFLTPVGRWNEIHAQPLVWTTSRPLTTRLPFDAHTTGAMLFGLLPLAGTEVAYAAYGQFVDAFDRPADERHPADRSAGLRLEWSPETEWTVGGSYAASRVTGEWDHLLGVDTLWHRGALEVMGEAVVADGGGVLEPQWGFYLQSVLRVLARTSLVGRYEHFDQRAPATEVNLMVAGVAFRPVPYVVLKAEYLFADHATEESPPGIKTSVAILF